MKNAIPGIAIAIGLMLLGGGSVWTSLFSPVSAWNEEKALRLSEVQARLSNLGPIVHSTRPSMRRGPDLATLKAEYDALKLENAQLNAEFESATDRPNTMAKILRRSGIALAAVGLTRYIQALLFDVGRLDVSSFIGMSAVMLVVALLASYIPARRASRVDPVIALRTD